MKQQNEMYPKNSNHIAEISSLFGHFESYISTSLELFQGYFYCKKPKCLNWKLHSAKKLHNLLKAI